MGYDKCIACDTSKNAVLFNGYCYQALIPHCDPLGQITDDMSCDLCAIDYFIDGAATKAKDTCIKCTPPKRVLNDSTKCAVKVDINCNQTNSSDECTRCKTGYQLEDKVCVHSANGLDANCDTYMYNSTAQVG